LRVSLHTLPRLTERQQQVSLSSSPLPLLMPHSSALCKPYKYLQVRLVLPAADMTQT
jgi:hypothetical protein